MKRLIVLLTVVAAFSLASCKKDYTCCYLDNTGNPIEINATTPSCTAGLTMSTKEMEERQASMDAEAKAKSSGYSARCTEEQ